MFLKLHKLVLGVGTSGERMPLVRPSRWVVQIAVVDVEVMENEVHHDEVIVRAHVRVFRLIVGVVVMFGVLLDPFDKADQL